MGFRMTCLGWTSRRRSGESGRFAVWPLDWWSEADKTSLGLRRGQLRPGFVRPGRVRPTRQVRQRSGWTGQRPAGSGRLGAARHARRGLLDGPWSGMADSLWQHRLCQGLSGNVTVGLGRRDADDYVRDSRALDVKEVHVELDADEVGWIRSGESRLVDGLARRCRHGWVWSGCVRPGVACHGRREVSW